MHISLGLLQARLIVLHSALFINSTVLLTYLVQLIYDQSQCIWMVDRPWKLLASLDGIKFKYIKLPICFLRYFYCYFFFGIWDSGLNFQKFHQAKENEDTFDFSWSLGQYMV